MTRLSRNNRIILVTLLVLGVFYYLRTPSKGLSRHEQALLKQRRLEIEAGFDHAWHGYSTYCMGHDSLHPVSNTCDDDFGGWGATAIDALSTAIIMRKESIVVEILQFISTQEFRKVKGGESINLFEVNIRHLGSMLSAWELLNGPFLGLVEDSALMVMLQRKIGLLGERLSCGFDTPSGIPRNWVNPDECHSDEGTSNTVAGTGTLILEFAKLSEITGNSRYVQLAQKAESFLLDPWPSYGEPFPGLLGSFVSVSDGSFLDSKGSWGSLADSFYEYLLKAYIYNSKAYAHYLPRWQLAADSTIRYVAKHAYGHPDWTFLPYWEETRTTNAMDALSWFAGGSFILGGMVTNNRTILDIGLSIADTAGAMYSRTPTGLGGEFVWWTETCSSDWGEEPCTAENSYRLSTMEYNLRPEVLETWYYAYRATQNRKYRDWAWSEFKAVERFCKTPSGYSSISDVLDPSGGRKLDKQESFIHAEFFKYMYLMHSEDDLDYQVKDSRRGLKNTWVFNTEGHPFRVSGNPV